MVSSETQYLEKTLVWKEEENVLTMESQNWLYLEMSPLGHSVAGQELLNRSSAPTGSNFGFVGSGSFGSGKNNPQRKDSLQLKALYFIFVKCSYFLSSSSLFSVMTFTNSSLVILFWARAAPIMRRISMVDMMVVTSLVWDKLALISLDSLF